MQDKKTERPYVLKLEIGAENLRTIINELNNIKYSLLVHLKENNTDTINVCVGGPSVGYLITARRTETKNNKEYFEMLEKENTKDG